MKQFLLEILGLAAVGLALVSGKTFGDAFPRVTGLLNLIAGAALVIIGIVIARSGAELGMLTFLIMPAGILLALFGIVMAWSGFAKLFDMGSSD